MTDTNITLRATEWAVSATESRDLGDYDDSVTAHARVEGEIEGVGADPEAITEQIKTHQQLLAATVKQTAHEREKERKAELDAGGEGG